MTRRTKVSAGEVELSILSSGSLQGRNLLVSLLRYRIVVIA